MTKDAIPPLPSSTEVEARCRMLQAISARTLLKNALDEDLGAMSKNQRAELRGRIIRLDLEAEHHLAVITKLRNA